MTLVFENRRRGVRFGAAILTFLVASSMTLLGAVGPASAHDVLLSSNPVDQSKLDAAPNQISLTFSADPMKNTAKMVAANQAGESVPLADPTIKGKTVTVPWPTQQGGQYTVTWRVVSSDGHPINGTLAFEYGSSDGSASTETPVESPSTSDNSLEDDSTDDAQVAPVSPNVGGMIAGLAAVVVAATVLVALLIRRRQGKDDDVS